jgi:teichuronic acid biosynthesis glycosyltransferase TuaC
MMKSRLVTLEREDPDANVLMVTSGWPTEDTESYGVFVKRQVDSLIDRGLRCDVLFVRGYRSPLAYPLAALRLGAWSFAKRRRYKIVHAHGGEAALAATFYRRAPLLVSYLGSDLLGTPRANGYIPLVSRIRRRLLRQHARFATGTVTKSRQMENALPPGLRKRNTVLPNGVDTRLFRPIARALARDELDWHREARVALFAADPSIPVKRYWLARAAVEHAQERLPDLRLEVAWGVSPDRMPLLLNAADCLLLTSLSEGSPNVVKEALMCNLPVVATPVGDVVELVDGVVPSKVCEPSEKALAEALVALLREPRRSNGRERSGRLDSRVIAESLLRLYQELSPEVANSISAACGADAVRAAPTG